MSRQPVTYTEEPLAISVLPRSSTHRSRTSRTPPDCYAHSLSPSMRSPSFRRPSTASSRRQRCRRPPLGHARRGLAPREAAHLRDRSVPGRLPAGRGAVDTGGAVRSCGPAGLAGRLLRPRTRPNGSATPSTRWKARPTSWWKAPTRNRSRSGCTSRLRDPGAPGPLVRGPLRAPSLQHRRLRPDLRRCVHLRRTYPNARITTNIRGFAMRPEDDTHFVNELFLPEFLDRFYRQDSRFRQKTIDDYGLAAHIDVRYDVPPQIYRKY
ncbi:SidA/IucD/PvdA family monooxygenase [Streptomyces sp. NPDC086771]|uniref:SidA/IucD/PvdA family monooxygenase n=1 Tax=unclassified Streptomyces TaxID=2593676 RepID=UPI00381C1FC4